MFLALSVLLFVCCNAGKTSVKHVIVVMLENRSFDHMFGYYPGVDGVGNVGTSFSSFFFILFSFVSTLILLLFVLFVFFWLSIFNFALV